MDAAGNSPLTWRTNRKNPAVVNSQRQRRNLPRIEDAAQQNQLLSIIGQDVMRLDHG